MQRCPGPASQSVRDAPDWARYVVTVRRDLDLPGKYATLVHELAHLYCGHLGADHTGGWEDRSLYSHEESELEAESVSYLVCRQAGVCSSSEVYLAQFVDNNKTMPPISPAVILKVAGRIEAMGEKVLPERKAKESQA
jgi:hypothetical protein